ncbi:MAG: OmpA family protein [Terracidiphilus sp.]|jgi:chemotaxis protein MotB
MRRRIQAEEPMNHDRWLVSYSDLITVLFALFVVLFASSYRDNQVIRKLSTAIHIGFQQLGAFQGQKIEGRDSNSNLPTEVPAGSAPVTGETAAKGALSTAPAVDFAQLRKQLEAAISDEIKNREVVMRVTPEGFVISLNDVGFFNSGQAVLMPGAAGKIRRIATVLAEHGLDLRVEGHSDDQPIHTSQFRSNWELSTARAMTVLMLLVDDSGIDPKKISIAGYGQYKPVADNATPEGRQQNRRVDLVVVGTATSPPRVP